MVYTVDVLYFAGTYFRGQLSPNQFAGIQICATRRSPQYIFHCVFKFAGINIRGDHVTAKINTQRNILLLQYLLQLVLHYCIHSVVLRPPFCTLFRLNWVKQAQVKLMMQHAPAWV